MYMNMCDVTEVLREKAPFCEKIMILKILPDFYCVNLSYYGNIRFCCVVRRKFLAESICMNRVIDDNKFLETRK